MRAAGLLGLCLTHRTQLGVLRALELICRGRLMAVLAFESVSSLLHRGNWSVGATVVNNDACVAVLCNRIAKQR